MPPQMDPLHGVCLPPFGLPHSSPVPLPASPGQRLQDFLGVRHEAFGLLCSLSNVRPLGLALIAMRDAHVGHPLEVLHARKFWMLVEEIPLNVDLFLVETGHKSLVHACSLFIALGIVQFLPHRGGSTHQQADGQCRF